MAVSMSKGTKVDLAARIGAMLGEGPVWVDRDRAVWFVDIKAPCIYRFEPGRGRLDQWSAPAEIGWVLPTRDAAFVAGLPDGIHQFHPASGRFAAHVRVEHPSHNRLNDATVDARGRIWLGTMDNLERDATGRFYRYQRGQLRDTGIEPMCITNGPAVSPDAKALYSVDTVAGTIDAWSIGDDGSLHDRRRFATIDASDGHPDGVTCDAEGGVWLGLWGGWCARRYSADGKVTQNVRLPVANVTKIALGGPDLRTAYATTARKGLDAAALAQQPQAGDLFSFRVDVPGVPPPLADVP
jgi:D-xylonolactonase